MIKNDKLSIKLPIDTLDINSIVGLRMPISCISKILIKQVLCS